MKDIHIFNRRNNVEVELQLEDDGRAKGWREGGDLGDGVLRENVACRTVPKRQIPWPKQISGIKLRPENCQ